MSRRHYNFSDISNEYLEYSRPRHKKQGFETISRNFKLHILPYFKERTLNSLSKRDIIDWQTEILNKDFSNNFNNALYYNFSAFFEYCMVNDYLSENLILKIPKFPKRIEPKNDDVYTIYEFRKFRFHLKDFIVKQYFNFMYFNGTRPSEAMALKFSDFDGLRVHIKYSLQRRGKREIDTTKNQSSNRIIKISILMWIRIYRLKKYYTKKYGSFNRDYFVFGGLKPLSTSTIDRRKKEACNRARMREITQHQFRHSFATRLIHHKKPIDTVSRRLGHSRVSTTVDVYLHEEKGKQKPSFFKINF